MNVFWFLDDEVDDSESPSRKNLAGIVDLVDEDDEVVAEKQSEVERMNYEDSFEEPDGEVIGENKDGVCLLFVKKFFRCG